MHMEHRAKRQQDSATCGHRATATTQQERTNTYDRTESGGRDFGAKQQQQQREPQQHYNNDDDNSNKNNNSNDKTKTTPTPTPKQR
jgi:hypothetical protein